MSGGCPKGKGSGCEPTTLVLPQHPEGLTPQSAAAEGGCWNLMGWKGKVLPVLPKEDRLREDPGPAASPVCKGHEKPAWKGQTALHKYSPELLVWEVHQHFPKGWKGATIQQGAWPRYKVIQYAPLSASGSNPTHRVRLCLLPYP